MKTLLKSLKITLAFCVFFSVFYILFLWLFAQVAGPNKGNAEVVTLNGKVVGAANVGQMFTKDIYFWGRPSCAGDGYDATSSAGSNKGPTNQEYLDEVKARIDTFLVHHPYLSRKRGTGGNGDGKWFRTRPEYHSPMCVCTGEKSCTGSWIEGGTGEVNS